MPMARPSENTRNQCPKLICRPVAESQRPSSVSQLRRCRRHWPLSPVQLTVRHFTEQTNGNSRGHSQPSDRYRVTLYRRPIRCALCPQTSPQSGLCYTPFSTGAVASPGQRPDVSTRRALVVEDLGRLRPLQARDELRALTERAAATSGSGRLVTGRAGESAGWQDRSPDARRAARTAALVPNARYEP